MITLQIIKIMKAHNRNHRCHACTSVILFVFFLQTSFLKCFKRMKNFSAHSSSHFHSKYSTVAQTVKPPTQAIDQIQYIYLYVNIQYASQRITLRGAESAAAIRHHYLKRSLLVVSRHSCCFSLTKNKTMRFSRCFRSSNPLYKLLLLPKEQSMHLMDVRI